MHRKLLFSLLFVTSTIAHSAMYKWTDENGKVVYSQSPPPKGQVTKIKPPPPPGESTESAQKKLQQRLQRLEDLKEDKQLAGEKAAKEEKSRQETADQCKKAKSDLAALSGGPNRMYKLPDGSYQRMTDTERQKRIDERKKYITKNCK